MTDCKDISYDPADVALELYGIDLKDIHRPYIKKVEFLAKKINILLKRERQGQDTKTECDEVNERLVDFIDVHFDRDELDKRERLWKYANILMDATLWDYHWYRY